MSGSAPGPTATLTLAPHPTSPKAARRHVAELLEAGPLAELADTASLLVSEVVTNAVLHAATDIVLSCTVDGTSVCIEVRDGSPVAPSPRPYDATATTGRGLGMVELLADEWGVDADERGKAVWFLLAGPDAGSTAPRIPSSGARRRSGDFEVRLGKLPVDLVVATIQYGDAVLREVVLLSIAAEARSGRPTTRPLSSIDLGPLLERLEAAQREGRSSVDLVLPFPEGAGAAALERLAMVDEADRMAIDGELLTAPSVPEISICRRWLHTQISLQEDGGPATDWSMPEPIDMLVGAPHLPDEERRRLDGLTVGAIVADDVNRILYVNRVAAGLLGWDGGELIGRRLACIVPPELRASHLAGFTRYLVTGEARLLGQRTRLPALRGDGSSVELDITITMMEIEGRQVFRATVEPPQV
jgi:PAS domain S-box-containing protein